MIGREDLIKLKNLPKNTIEWMNNLVKKTDKITEDIETVNEQLDTMVTDMLSSKSFNSLQHCIDRALELNIKNIYVDKDFENETINLSNGVKLYSDTSKKIKNINIKGSRGSQIAFSEVTNNYVATNALSDGDIIIIDCPSKYREINKVLYIDGGKAYLENNLLFEYSENIRVIKINEISNVILENIEVYNLTIQYANNITLDNLTITHKGNIAMSLDINSTRLVVNSEKNTESRLDIFSCTRNINIDNLIGYGGNTESDNSNIKLNQVANVNINNLLLKSAYKPINKYGYNGYYHNFMIDGAISEIFDFLGDDCNYPNYPSKFINISNVNFTGKNNIYNSLFLTVVENLNISNITNCKNVSVKNFKNMNITNCDTELLRIEGTADVLNITNANIGHIDQFNNISNAKFNNVNIKNASGGNNNLKNIMLTNCKFDFTFPGYNAIGVDTLMMNNCIFEKLLFEAMGDINVLGDNCGFKNLKINGSSNIHLDNMYLINDDTNSVVWVQNTSNCIIKGSVKNSENTFVMNNGGGVGYNTEVIFLSKLKKHIISYFLINASDVEWHITNKTFKYRDIVENRDPMRNQPQKWICIDNKGTLVALNKIGYDFA